MPSHLKKALVILILFFIPFAGYAHVHLDNSSPKDNETLSEPPTAIKLWFSGNVESAWSKIEVKDSHGNRVDSGDVISINNDLKTLIVPLKNISSGQYKVRWNVVANDGHRIKGGLSFSVD